MKPIFVKAQSIFEEKQTYWVNVNNISLIKWTPDGALISVDVDAVNKQTFTLKISDGDAERLTGEVNPLK